MKQQEVNGFKFDEMGANLLLAELREQMQSIEDEVHKTFQPRLVDDKLVSPYVKKGWYFSKRGLTDDEYERCLNTSDYRPFMRQILQEFNLGSRKQIGEYLTDFGWKPIDLHLLVSLL